VVCANSERGVEGVEVHPDFETNRYIFIYYTFNKNGNCDEDPFIGPVNRLSRFVLPTNNIIDISSETVFFETQSLEYDHHNSGDIEFGNDGNMYVTVGDGGSTFSGVSSDPGNLLGSMIRLTADGDIPTDNPFTFQSGESNSVRCNATGLPPAGSPAGAKCQEIFAMGLRNPFRMAMDPNTAADVVRFYVNDVGQAKWEEISEGGSDFIGAHYGWPAREGPCPNSLTANCADVHPYTDPVHFYIHNSDAGGGACTGK
jgi:glucose/arabinose dehydrogenase